MNFLAGIDIVSSSRGGKYINDTTALVGIWRAFAPTSECVVDEILDETGQDITAEVISTPSNPVDGGALLVAARGRYWTSVKLTSGRGWAIKEYNQD